MKPKVIFLSPGLLLCALVTLAPLSSSRAGDASKAEPICGTRPDDWCPAPPGDACGQHGDVEACKADQKCVGLPYRGESFVACTLDSRGFSSNCPTVGCISKAVKKAKTPPR